MNANQQKAALRVVTVAKALSSSLKDKDAHPFDHLLLSGLLSAVLNQFELTQTGNPEAVSDSTCDKPTDTLRDKFAAAAPDVIPDWFGPRVNVLSNGPVPSDHRQQIAEQARYAAWRWHYADMMLAFRNAA